MDMFDNEEFDNCNNEYQDEWAARDRAGGVAHPLLQGTNMGGEMGKLQSKLYKINISDEEKFAMEICSEYFCIIWIYLEMSIKSW